VPNRTGPCRTLIMVGRGTVEIESCPIRSLQLVRKILSRLQSRVHQCTELVSASFGSQSAIQAGGFRSLQEGQTVQLDVTKGPKGFQAENVKRS
jgi:hypothetical protein